MHNLKPGDEIIVPKSSWNIIKHHALYIGHDEIGTHWIIHNTADIGVSLITVDDFFARCPHINKIMRFTGTNEERKRLVERAVKKIGQPYGFINYNCEHFTSEVKTGKATSRQVEGAFAVLMFGFLITALGSTK